MLKIARLPVSTCTALAEVSVCLQPLAPVPAPRLN